MSRTADRTEFSFEGFANPTTTPVPDVVFDQFLSKLGEAELKALLYIIRRTFGFKRDHDSISFNQFLRGITRRDGRVLDEGCGVRDRTTLSRALKSLETKGIIHSEKGVDERGENETTIYSLRFREDRPQGVVGNSYHPSRNNPPPVVGNSYPQETGSQETVRQEAERASVPLLSSEDISSSNIRKGDPRISEIDGESRAKDLADQEGSQARSATVPARTPAEVDVQLPRGIQTTAAVLTHRYSRRQRVPSEAQRAIGAYIHDFALEFGDQAPLRSTVTRAMRLYEKSGISLGDFISCLHAARSVVKEYSGNIRKGRGEQSAGWKPANKVPYFFAVLEDQLGLRGQPCNEDRAELAQEQQPERPTPAWRTQTPRGRPDRRPRRSIGGPLVPVISRSARAEYRDFGNDGEDPSEQAVAAQKRPKSGRFVPKGTGSPPGGGTA
jgi:hypothetical protein